MANNIDKVRFNGSRFSNIVFGTSTGPKQIKAVTYNGRVIWELSTEPISYVTYDDTCSYDWSDTGNSKFVWHILKTIDGETVNVDDSFSKANAWLFRDPKGVVEDQSARPSAGWPGIDKALTEREFDISDIEKFPPGLYRITVRCYSKADNSYFPSSSQKVNEQGHNLLIPLQVSNLTGEFGDYELGQTTIDWNTILKQDNKQVIVNDCIDHYVWQMVEVDRGLSNDPETVTSPSADITGVKSYPGKYKMHVSAYDSAGNFKDFVSDYFIYSDKIDSSCNAQFAYDGNSYKLSWNVVDADETVIDDSVENSKLKITKADNTVVYEDTTAKEYTTNEFDVSNATTYPAGDYKALLYAYGKYLGETGWKPATPYSFTITRGGLTYTAGLRGVWIGKTFTKTTKIKSFTVYTANTTEGVPFGSIASPEGIVLYRLDALSNTGTAEIDVYDSESETTTKTTVQKWTCSPDKTITCYAGKTYYFIISPSNWGTNNIQYYVTNKADGNCFELPDASAPAYSCKSAISYDLGDYTYVGSSSTVPENPVENGLYLDSNADTHTAWDGTTTSVNRCYMHFADGEWHYVCSYGNWDSPIDQFITDSKYASTKNYYLTITEDI